MAKKETAREKRERIKQERLKRIREGKIPGVKAIDEENNFAISTTPSYEQEAKELESFVDIEQETSDNIETAAKNVYKISDSIFGNNIDSYKNNVGKEGRRAKEWLISMPVHTEYPTPDFLLDPEKEEERREQISKLQSLLKGNKYALTVVADILIYNNYSDLDSILEERELLFSQITSIEEKAETKFKFTSYFKGRVGARNSSFYDAQKKEMEGLLEYIASGKMFEQARISKNEDNSSKSQISNPYLGSDPDDIRKTAISDVVDTPNFNLACEIETSFMAFECSRLSKILTDLKARYNLEDLIQKLQRLEDVITTRKDAYNTIYRLVSGKDKPPIIIEDERE